jgi:GTP pyrophosphokinase
MPSDAGPDKTLWDKLLRFTGNRSTDELFGDIGMGKRIASMVAKKLAATMTEAGHRPDPLLISTARFSVDEESVVQGVLQLLRLRRSTRRP